MIKITAWASLRYLFPFKGIVRYNYSKQSMIANPTTLGCMLRNRRLELGLSQPQVAQILKTNPQYIYAWENNHNKPGVSKFPKIIGFLGYFPFEIDTSTIGGKIKEYRYQHGLSQEKMAHYLNVDEGTVIGYEKGKRTPISKKKYNLILKFIK